MVMFLFALFLTSSILSTHLAGAVKYTTLDTPCLHSEYHAACHAANLLPATITDFAQVYRLLDGAPGEARVWIRGYQKEGKPANTLPFLSVTIDPTVTTRKHLSIDLIDTDQDTTRLRPLCVQVEFGSVRGEWVRSMSDERLWDGAGKKKRRAKKPVAVEQPSTVYSADGMDEPSSPSSPSYSSFSATATSNMLKAKSRRSQKHGHVRRASAPMDEMQSMRLAEMKEPLIKKGPQRKNKSDDEKTADEELEGPPSKSSVTVGKSERSKDAIASGKKGGKNQKAKKGKSNLNISKPFNVSSLSEIPFENVSM